ncbi:hypothetical protein JK386_04450 [Nocardioides sp. zg-536]|uniref:Uncharacterized protein n=1 Tax=Nocardioides faecalis TaxID=2803858 RepID=A0A938Y4N9_9ACTN|nr:hypothetical protein [Nocardioides faecalis]MBM9459142.1 hypothetical protein [Nocardioides faecalis]QVI59716.1 hypothetical protein KG111_05065 [Nocardioides faecalis]
MQDDLDIRMLEFIYDACEASGGPADAFGAWGTADTDDLGRATAASLKDRGLIRADLRMVAGYYIEPEGRRIVQEARSRRTDRAYRRSECRTQLLRWADTGGRLARRDFPGSADGLPFSMEESAQAAEYLMQKGLLISGNAWGEPHFQFEITEFGRECIDSGSSITEFLKPALTSVGPTINVHGTGNNVAAALGRHSTATATMESFDHEAAIQVAEAIRQALSVLSLPPETEDLLDDITQREDPSRAQRALARLYPFLGELSTGALGGVLGNAASGALGI